MRPSLVPDKSVARILKATWIIFCCSRCRRIHNDVIRQVEQFSEDIRRYLSH